MDHATGQPAPRAGTETEVAPSRWTSLAGVLLAGVLAALSPACTDEVNGQPPNLVERLFVPRTFTLPLGHPLAYVTNTGTDGLRVIDLTDMSLAARLPVGVNPVDKDGPGALAFDARRRLLYVALTEPTASTYGPHSVRAVTKTGFVVVLDADNLAVRALWPVARSPASLALSADGDTLWVSHSDGVRASQLSEDITARRATVGRFSSLGAALAKGELPRWELATVCVLPEGIALDEADGLLGVACAGEDSVAFLDTATLTVRARVAMVRGGDLAKPLGLSLSPDGGTWTVSNRVARDVAFLSAGALPALLDRPLVQGYPSQPFWAATGKLLVPMTSPDEIDVIDPGTHGVVAEHPFDAGVCVTPKQIVEAPGAALLVLCAGDSQAQARLLELDGSTLEVRRAAELESYAHSIVVRMP